MGHEVQRKFFFLIGVTCFFDLVIEVLTPIQTLYMRAVGATMFEVGMMLAVSNIFGMVLKIPFTFAADRYGRKPIILIGLAAEFFSILFLYFTQAPIWFYPILALYAVPTAAVWSQAVALASDMAPVGRRGEIMGKYFFAFGIAMFLGPLLCSILTIFLSYQGVLLVTLFFPLISIILFLIGGLANQNGKALRQPYGGRVNGLTSLRKIIKSRNILALCIGEIFISFGVAILTALFSIFAKESLFLSASLISILYTARGGMNALVRIPIGKFSDKVGRKKPLIIAYLLYALPFLIASLTANYLILLLAMASYGAGWGIHAVVNNTLITENVDPNDSGLVLSVAQTMSAFGLILGSAFAGIAVAFITITDIFKFTSITFFFPIFVLILIVKENL